MDVKNFILSYYKKTDNGIHIQKVEKSLEAQKPHTHEYFQIYYILRGSLVHNTKSDSARLSQGDMFIIPPKKIHYISEAEDVCFYSFSFMMESIGGETDSTHWAVNFLKSLLQDENVRAKITVPIEENLFIESLMGQIYKEFTAKEAGYGDIIRASALSLVSFFARNYFKDEPTLFDATDNKSLMLHCVEYMKENCGENITLLEMARNVAMSRSGFCKRFYELTGATFYTYLNGCRIRKAIEYMKKDYKITAIYGLCGFGDFTTFYRNFKKVTGMSPRTYKEQILKLSETQENEKKIKPIVYIS